jgi:hypothetical protein
MDIVWPMMTAAVPSVSVEAGGTECPLPLGFELVARSAHPSVSSDLTSKELLKLAFVTPHRRGEIERLPRAISDL